ncbi:LPXTG cell wall anchor domain-containing protein [Thermobifida alba]|uniref:LPXTG cell wall anchor domain-containing protein n=1 Tax=Thermobifida alba TaxID=53522 RepID=A0ABY4L647_THEAE|nr:LPXTG cell wall anchor domain-containing protein [Thermobifida alba]
MASGLSAALAFSAISFLAWQTADHPVGEPATDPSTVLVHDASGVTEWECFAESSVGSSAANCSGRAESLPATPEFDLPSGGWEAVAGPAVPHGPDASWPAEWPPPAATRLDEEILGSPDGRPTDRPTASPTDRPTHSPTHHPTHRPTHRPTDRPTASPTDRPTHRPTHSPTHHPTHHPTHRPTHHPTHHPTHRPTASPTHRPTHHPTHRPTHRPTHHPTHHPTHSPTASPTQSPTGSPTHSPTVSPTRPPSGGGSLPVTGVETMAFAAIAGAVALAGAALIAGSRRRRPVRHRLR